MILDDANVTITYGRNGTDGTKSVKRFSSCKEAEEFMTKIKFEKLAKGYKHIPDHDNRKHQRNNDQYDDEDDLDEELSFKRSTSKYLENKINYED